MFLVTLRFFLVADVNNSIIKHTEPFLDLFKSFYSIYCWHVNVQQHERYWPIRSLSEIWHILYEVAEDIVDVINYTFPIVERDQSVRNPQLSKVKLDLFLDYKLIISK